MVDLETFVSSESNLLDCVRFHFMSILRKELTGISIEWNPHLLSPSRNNTSSGKPNFMYFPPHFYGTIYCMISTNSPKTDKFVNITSSLPSDYSNEIAQFAETLMNE